MYCALMVEIQTAATLKLLYTEWNGLRVIECHGRKGTVHPMTGHDGPEGRTFIAPLFL